MKTKIELGNKSKLNVMFRPAGAKGKKTIKERYYPAQLYEHCMKEWKKFNSVCTTFIQVRAISMALDNVIYKIKIAEEGKIIRNFVDTDPYQFFLEVTHGATKTQLINSYNKRYGTENNSD
jgi:hypothetical protein